MPKSVSNLLTIGVRQKRWPLNAPFRSESPAPFPPLSVKNLPFRPRNTSQDLILRPNVSCLDLNSRKPLHRACQPLTDRSEKPGAGVSPVWLLDTLLLLALILICLAPQLPACSWPHQGPNSYPITAGRAFVCPGERYANKCRIGLEPEANAFRGCALPPKVTTRSHAYTSCCHNEFAPKLLHGPITKGLEMVHKTNRNAYRINNSEAIHLHPGLLLGKASP